MHREHGHDDNDSSDRTNEVAHLMMGNPMTEPHDDITQHSPHVLCAYVVLPWQWFYTSTFLEDTCLLFGVLWLLIFRQTDGLETYRITWTCEQEHGVASGRHGTWEHDTRSSTS